MSAVFETATRELVIEFDQAMDMASLPVGDGVNIEFNALGMDRYGITPLSWSDSTHLRVNTSGGGPFVPPVDADTTRCTNTAGMQSPGGTQAAAWNGVTVSIV